MSFKFSVTGIQETISRLATFDKKFRSKTLRKAGNEASKLALRAMKANAPVAKKDYGPSGGLRKSLGRKVQVKNGGLRLWYGVGPRTKWMTTVAKANKYWRDSKGRMRKAPISWNRKEQPSRRAHLSEKKSEFISRTQAGTRHQQEAALQRVLAEAMSEV